MARNLQLLIVAISSFLLGGYLDSFLSSENPTPQHPLASSAFSNQALEKNYAEAQQQIQQLKIQLAQYQVPLSPSSEFPQKPSSTIQAVIEPANNALHAAEAKLAELRAEKYMKWSMEQTKKTGDFSLGNEMQTRFNAESINQEWASAQEKKLAGLFVEKAELSGVALKDTKCRATQCQISIGVNNIEQANFIAEKFSKLAAENKFMSVIAVPDITAGNTMLYVSSSDQGFEFN